MNTSESIHHEAEIWAAAASTGGLTETELQAWNSHIATCPACKKLNEEERAMADLIKQTLNTDSPDPGFEQRILQRLDRARPGNGNRWYEYLLFHPGLSAAAACLLLVAIIGAGSLIRGGKTAAGPASLVSLDGLPPAVRDTIQRQAEGKTISNIERDDENGEVSYTVAAKAADGGELDFTVAGDGAYLGIDTTLADVPQDVRNAINNQTGEGSVEGIGKTFDGGETNYVATIASKDGRERDFTFAQDGTLLSVETALDELPPPVQASVKIQMGQGRLKGVDKTFDGSETNYVATIISPDGRERDFEFSGDGKLSSVEVAPDEIPDAARTAISAQVGGGSLDGINKTYDDGEITYDASVTGSDGHRRDFSISEQGKLLSKEVAMNEAPKAVQQAISRTLGEGKVVAIDQSFDEPDNIVPYEIEARKDGKPLYFVVSPTGDLLSMEN